MCHVYDIAVCCVYIQRGVSDSLEHTGRFNGWLSRAYRDSVLFGREPLCSVLGISRRFLLRPKSSTPTLIAKMSTIEPLYSTLRFVSSSGPPSSGKRRIAQHACDRCRQRKKRCFNGDNAVTDDAGDAGRVSSTEPGDADATKNTNHHILDVASGMIDVSNGNAASNSHPRYIGDLNPEVELLAATEPNQVPKNSTGVWHSESVQNSHESGDKHVAAPWSILHGLPLGTQESLLPLLRQQCLETIPTRENFLELERYYFERIHSLLPSIDEAIYRSSLVGSPTENLQKQCVCLLASTSLSMRQYLRLGNDLRTLQPNEYARRVVGAMRLIIDLALVTDKIVLIYALTTMSLFVYGRESLELTSQYFFRAVQVAYSIGLHQPRDTKQDEKVAGMFSYIWSIDRLHAAMQGRPIVMHEIDMAKSPLSCAVDQQAGFKVLVHIAALLDKVIGLYRPTALRKEIPDEEFPLFEEVLEKCNALTLRACDQGKMFAQNAVAKLKWF